jgi:hypothetical protein
MISCLQFCLKFAFNFHLRRYNSALASNCSYDAARVTVGQSALAPALRGGGVTVGLAIHLPATSSNAF